MICKKCKEHHNPDCMLTGNSKVNNVCVFCHYKTNFWDSNGQSIKRNVDKISAEKIDNYFRGVDDGQCSAIVRLYWFTKNNDECKTAKDLLKSLIPNKNKLFLSFKLTKKEWAKIERMINTIRNGAQCA